MYRKANYFKLPFCEKSGEWHPVNNVNIQGLIFMSELECVLFTLTRDRRHLMQSLSALAEILDR